MISFHVFGRKRTKKMFAQLAPIIHTDLAIISHGYLCCDFVPTCLAFPGIALVFLGCSVKLYMLQSFVKLTSHVERKVLKEILI